MNGYNLSPYHPRRQTNFPTRRRGFPDRRAETQRWIQCIAEGMEPLSPIKYEEPSYRKIQPDDLNLRFKFDHQVRADRPRVKRPLTVLMAVSLCLLGVSWQLYTFVSEFVR